ncbi:MAG: hypothetical protein AAGD86_04230, partial [Pseudomonadota bacterium]
AAGPATPAAAWPAVASYVQRVREAVVLPLGDELAAVDVVAAATAAWTEQAAAAGTVWSELSKRDQQLLAPLVPFWQAVAGAVSALEQGVSQWTRQSLDGASALDGGAPPALGAAESATDLPEASAPEADPAAVPTPAFDLTVYHEAGSHLAARLSAAQALFADLTAALMPTLSEAAASRRKKLAAAAAKDAADGADTLAAAELLAEEAAAPWQTWFEQANARVALAGARLAAFTALADGQADFLDGLGRKGPGQWALAAGHAAGHLRELKSRAEGLYAELDASHDGRLAIRQATEFFREATGRLDKDYVGVTSPGEASRFAEEHAAAMLAAVRATAQTLPDTLQVHSLPESDEQAVNPRAPAREVTLRPAILEAIDAILEPAFADATGIAKNGVAALADEAANLQSVLRFHLGAATEELRDAYWKRSSSESRSAADAAARELSLAGLDRVVETLGHQQRLVDECLTAVSARLTAARGAVWQSIGTQVQAETATQKLTLKTRSRLSGYLLEARERATQAALALLQATWKQARAGGERLVEAFHVSRKAVTGESEPVDRQASIDAVAKLDDIRAKLPVVYRHLFTFYPLSDETLLAGRDKDMTWLRKQLLLWRRGRARAFVLSSLPGSGLTTFLNVARQTCLRAANVTEVDIAQRVTDEATLTALLAAALSLPEADAPPADLGELADRIVAREATSVLDVCIVERLEHLFLRRIGGTDLLGRLLRFFSATDSRVFWIGTVSDFAWQLLSKSEPLALGLVHYRKMSSYDREAVEEVIVKRHRRSGLPLSFDPPATVSPFFRRRLRKAGSDEARQALLQAEYFDDLFAASGQNIMLALFYWHLSITYHSEPASIQVNALPRLSFDFLAFLSLPEAFALKAFLEHATLTVDEYSRIADVSLDASVETFESLGNSMLIELDANEYRDVANVEFERIEPERRYRLRPLLVQPVIRHLRTKNIVH